MSKPAKKRSAVVQLDAARVRRIAGHRVGSACRDGAGLFVDYPENPHGRLRARTTLAHDAILGLVEGQRREALLVFEDERSDRPIVIGLLAETAAPALGEPKLVANVDGKRVVIEGHDEIVLRCGEASITLRRNGRVVVRGVYVETRARGVNRIKGGSVQIN
jgi:hypothetical protein